MAGQWVVDAGGSMVRLVAGMAGRGRDRESVILKFGCWMEEKILSCTLALKEGGFEFDRGAYGVLIYCFYVPWLMLGCRMFF